MTSDPGAFRTLMAFARTQFPEADPVQSGSILKALLRRWRPDDVEAMIRGAAQLGWRNLLGLNSREGLGRRWAQVAFWDRQKRPPAGQTPEPLKRILRSMGE